MRVALVNPPYLLGTEKFIREGRCTQKGGIWSFVYPPYSLLSTAALLRKNFFHVDVFDFSVEKFNKDFVEHYEVIIVNVGSASFISDTDFIRWLKKNNNNLQLGVIGTHIASNPEFFLKEIPQIDFVIKGEPEQAVLQVLEEIKEKGNSRRKIYSCLITDLDSLPFPLWDSFDMSNYRNPLTGKTLFMIVPQRGCGWECSFCTAPLYYGKTFRYRSVENIKMEIDYIKSFCRDFEVLFWSDTFTANRKFVFDICKLMKSENVRWVSNSRVDTLDEEMIKSLSNSGCRVLTLGLESASQEILDKNRKGLELEKAKKNIELLSRSKISTVGHFILGLPGETEETLVETLKFVKESQLNYAQFYYSTPFPGTVLFDGLPGTEREKLLNNYSQDIPSYTHNIDARLLREYRRKMVIALFFRTKTFVFLVKSLNIRFLIGLPYRLLPFIKWLQS